MRIIKAHNEMNYVKDINQVWTEGEDFKFIREQINDNVCDNYWWNIR